MRRVPVLITNRGTRLLRRRNSLMLPASRRLDSTTVTAFSWGGVISIASRSHHLLEPIPVRAADVQFGPILQDQRMLAVEPGHRLANACNVHDRGAMDTDKQARVQARFHRSHRGANGMPFRPTED